LERVLGYALAASMWAQPFGVHAPRFPDYPVKEEWQGPANLKLATQAGAHVPH
jgi:hypothetical protein